LQIIVYVSWSVTNRVMWGRAPNESAGQSLGRVSGTYKVSRNATMADHAHAAGASRRGQPAPPEAAPLIPVGQRGRRGARGGSRWHRAADCLCQLGEALQRDGPDDLILLAEVL
jgi:hypothetical protein